MEVRKNKKYDLERKRPLFFGIGMCISLGLAITAFQWKTPIDPIDIFKEPEEDAILMVLEETIITRQELKPPVVKMEQPPTSLYYRGRTKGRCKKRQQSNHCAGSYRSSNWRY